jgi:glycosyltransferase involved in cell wall biosynthesis
MSEPTVQKLAADNVIVTGKVPDLRTYYSLAQVSICPIRFGAGTLNKVIEPMAMGIPVVSTSISCVGMNVTQFKIPTLLVPIIRIRISSLPIHQRHLLSQLLIS